MTEKQQLKSGTLSLVKADVTDYEIDAFVFYARDDLKLGSGFGNAIAMRGGPSIRKELEEIGSIKVTEAVATNAGDMKAKFIIHADGPKFQEADTEAKLKKTIINTLKCAEEKGAESLALPPMGAGFYGVPIEKSAEITVQTIAAYMNNGSKLKSVVICAMDNREFKPLQEQFNVLQLATNPNGKK